MTRLARSAWLPAAVLLLTVGQLAVAQWWPGIERFADKAFGARLVAYPVLMLVAPAAWWWLRRRADRPVGSPGVGSPGVGSPGVGSPGVGSAAGAPYGAFTLVMSPFLVDVTGNSLDLYDTVAWWDDANHFVNWLLLLTGIGLLLGRRVTPDWALVTLVAGLGAVLAIGWELGEWFTFIRHGTEIATAYEDTLGDLALGTLGALAAGGVVLALRRRGLDD